MTDISIVIPYHRSVPFEFLEEAIDSVLTQTVQETTVSVEVVVMEDNEDLGPAETRNRGVFAAQGEWLVLLDADDTIAPTFLQEAIEVAKNGVEVIVPSSSPLTEAILRDNYLPYCCMIRGDVWDFLGGYQEPSDKGNGLCDWDWWIKCWHHKIPIGYIDPKLFNHRDREGSMSKWTMEHFEAMRADLWKKWGVE